MFKPKYTITDKMAKDLMDIQKAATLVDLLPLPSSVLELLRKEAREQTVILSTKIEGNPLDERSKREVLYAESEDGNKQEVYNLMKAIDSLEECEKRGLPITEEFIKKLHAIIRVHPGRKPKTSEYRTEQNQVGKRHLSGFYLPPEYQDVPALMEDLVAWVNSPSTYQMPAPIKAGIFMWQILTIHPYMDGNGRTARMLATYILRTNGLGLKGLFVLESFYDRNLNEYYKNLKLGLHHNYYFGRNDADITKWLEFFIEGLSAVFTEAAKVVEEKNLEYMAAEPDLIRELDLHQRIVFTELAFKYNWASTTDLRNWLGLADRTIRDKVKKWIRDGFLEKRDEDAKRVRSVVLGPRYRELANEIRMNPHKYRYLLR